MSATGLLLVADLRRPPAAQLSTRAALGAIHVYQATLSPLYARTGVICRFKPTCSHYGEAVVREFGVVRGGLMALKRVFRCGPWTPMGTDDPPPTQSSLLSHQSSITDRMPQIAHPNHPMNPQSAIVNHHWTPAQTPSSLRL